MSSCVGAYTNCKHPDQVVKNRSEETQEMFRNHDAHLPRDTKGRRVEEQINQINATYESIDAQIKKNCNTGTALERSVDNYWELKPVLHARNLIFNSASN